MAKPDLDQFVANSLGLDLKHYGEDKSRNPLYKAIANEIGDLRRAGVLIDWQKVGPSRTGMGAWRPDKTKLEEFARRRVGEEMAKKNYHSAGRQATVYVGRSSRPSGRRSWTDTADASFVNLT